MNQQQFIFSLLIIIVVLFVQSISVPTAKLDVYFDEQMCPLVTCFSSCPNGYVIDADGCQTCECNPCRFGQPSLKISCGGGQGDCAKMNGLCKVSTIDNAYCCPNERPGCCPPGPDLTEVACLPATCQDDFKCAVGQKCCGPCYRCTNSTLY